MLCKFKNGNNNMPVKALHVLNKTWNFQNILIDNPLA